MSRGLNKVQLIGNLGQDPELRYTKSGTAVVNARLATNSRYKDADGDYVDQTEWHGLVAFGKLAEIVDEYLTKGSQIYVEGKLQTRSWEDDEGTTHYRTEVKFHELIMLGSAQKRDRQTVAEAVAADDDLPF